MASTSSPSPSKPTPKPSSTSLRVIVAAFIPTLLSLLFYRQDIVLKTYENAGKYLPLKPSLSLFDRSSAFNGESIHGNGSTRYSGASRIESMAYLYSNQCPLIPYRTRIFSYDPLIVYVEDFIPLYERLYLMNITAGKFAQSGLLGEHKIVDGKDEAYTSSYRTSQSTTVYHDPVAACILMRAAAFQGDVPLDHVESLQVVKYGIGKEFREHYDWGLHDPNPRVSTFFGYVACDGEHVDVDESGPAKQKRLGKKAPKTCTGGETHFPYFEPKDIRSYAAALSNTTTSKAREPGFATSWCDVIDCQNKTGLEGISFKAIPGNAVFWMNVHPNGSYHEDTMHAGLPVSQGRKIGINIWTRRDVFTSNLTHSTVEKTEVSDKEAPLPTVLSEHQAAE